MVPAALSSLRISPDGIAHLDISQSPDFTNAGLFVIGPPPRSPPRTSEQTLIHPNDPSAAPPRSTDDTLYYNVSNVTHRRPHRTAEQGSVPHPAAFPSHANSSVCLSRAPPRFTDDTLYYNVLSLTIRRPRRAAEQGSARARQHSRATPTHPYVCRVRRRASPMIHCTTMY